MRISERLRLLPGPHHSTKRSAAALGGEDTLNMGYLWAWSRVRMRRDERSQICSFMIKELGNTVSDGPGYSGAELWAFSWGERRCQKQDPSILLFSLLTMLLLQCPSSYITVETSSLHQLICFPYSLISSLTCLVSSPLHPYLLWFSVVPVRKEVERWLWDGKFGPGSGNILLGGISSPLACREEMRWGWAVDVGASLIKKEKSRQMGMDVYPGIR